MRPAAHVSPRRSKGISSKEVDPFHAVVITLNSSMATRNEKLESRVRIQTRVYSYANTLEKDMSHRI